MTAVVYLDCNGLRRRPLDWILTPAGLKPRIPSCNELRWGVGGPVGVDFGLIYRRFRP